MDFWKKEMKLFYFFLRELINDDCIYCNGDLGDNIINFEYKLKINK